MRRMHRRPIRRKPGGQGRAVSMTTHRCPTRCVPDGQGGSVGRLTHRRPTLIVPGGQGRKESFLTHFPSTRRVPCGHGRCVSTRTQRRPTRIFPGGQGRAKDTATQRPRTRIEPGGHGLIWGEASAGRPRGEAGGSRPPSAPQDGSGAQKNSAAAVNKRLPMRRMGFHPPGRTAATTGDCLRPRRTLSRVLGSWPPAASGFASRTR